MNRLVNMIGTVIVLQVLILLTFLGLAIIDHSPKSLDQQVREWNESGYHVIYEIRSTEDGHTIETRIW